MISNPERMQLYAPMSDLLATAIFVGMEGHSLFNCIFCHGDPSDFKTAAGHEKAVLPQRTAATQVDAFAAYRNDLASGSRDPHVNGVHAEPHIPIGWGWLILPWLHLTLGTGNEVVKMIYVQLLKLDGIDQAALDNLEKLAEEPTECEHFAMENGSGRRRPTRP